MLEEYPVKTKGIYDEAEDSDGLRIFVDRIWPRGISREEAKLDLWLRDIAPSNELRRWFNHDGTRWDEFRRRYFQELRLKGESVLKLKDYMKTKPLTLLYATTEREKNNAAAMKEYITRELSLM